MTYWMPHTLSRWTQTARQCGPLNSDRSRGSEMAARGLAIPPC